MEDETIAEIKELILEREKLGKEQKEARLRNFKMVFNLIQKKYYLQKK